MYLNTRKHYLSQAICLSSILGLIAQFLNSISRVIFSSKLNEPDMLNSVIFNFNIGVQILVVVITTFIFFYNRKQLRAVIALVGKDDSEEIGLLQKEFNPRGISTLRAESIYQLVEIWASIMVFTQIMSMVSNYEYKRFVNDLYAIIPMENYEESVVFSQIYNSTHGFKYIGMFAALIIGIVTTAVFLKDRFLKVIAVIITVFFFLAFSLFQMITFDTQIKIISIVWTSVIYHGMETVGLLLFSIYLARHYKGL